MKITSKILHIPPYLSTSWLQVKALYLKTGNLIVSFSSDEKVEIPDLPLDLLDLIFQAYSDHLEERQIQQKNITLDPAASGAFQMLHLGTPFPGLDPKHIPVMRMNLDSTDSIAQSLQHNSAQAHLPDLPKEMLQKIVEITKVMMPEGISNLPKAEPHCNCPHCQIARAVHGQEENSLEIEQEEPITKNDLEFQQWDIKQIADQMHAVTNRLDPSETYNVFLGEPVGCTCGKPGCEHIVAVLKS